MSVIDNLKAMLDGGQDSALLRFSLGNAYFGDKDYSAALPHLESAVTQDAEYSAAWKLYGRCLVELERYRDAETAFVKGIAVARERGDIQAAKEMEVFLKRSRKALGKGK